MGLFSLTMKYYHVAIQILLLSFTPYALSSGVSNYVPVNVDPIVERDIERLMVFANLTDLSKPYSVALIEQGLDKIATTQPQLHARLSRYLAHYKKPVGLTHGAIQAQYRADDNEGNIARVNARGTTLEENVSVSFRGHLGAGDWLLLNVGGQFSNEQSQASGSLLSVGTSWAQLDVGYKEYWLSPFVGAAQLLSTHAQTLPSLSLSNNLPLTFFDVGFNYEFFIAQLSKQPTAFNDTYSDSKAPMLASTHISFQPFPWWTLGATRMFQFGGGERPLSAGTLARAFYDPRGADNDASVNEESGNQVASLASKMIFDGLMPFSLSVELAGEDTSNNKDFQLGNPALTAGLFFPAFFSNDLSFTYEYADWDRGWYVNNVYQEGYTHEGFILGHWAMQDQHAGGTAVPGHSHFIGAQWWTPWDHTLDLKVRNVSHDNRIYSRAWNIDVDYLIPIKAQSSVGLGAFFGRDSFDNSFVQLRVSAKWR
jgi:hypothetical protein